MATWLLMIFCSLRLFSGVGSSGGGLLAGVASLKIPSGGKQRMILSPAIFAVLGLGVNIVQVFSSPVVSGVGGGFRVFFGATEEWLVSLAFSAEGLEAFAVPLCGVVFRAVGVSAGGSGSHFWASFSGGSVRSSAGLLPDLAWSGAGRCSFSVPLRVQGLGGGGASELVCAHLLRLLHVWASLQVRLVASKSALFASSSPSSWEAAVVASFDEEDGLEFSVCIICNLLFSLGPLRKKGCILMV